MKVRQVTDPGVELEHPDVEHAHALAQTGFWGRKGTGSLFLSQASNRIGIAHRSDHVEQPGTYGTVGGAIDPNENPLLAAIREATEELGYVKQPGDTLIPLDTFESGTFQYTTFLYVVENEFAPRLNWENQGFVWVEFGNWPEPLHFGLASTLGNPECLRIIKDKLDLSS